MKTLKLIWKLLRCDQAVVFTGKNRPDGQTAWQAQGRYIERETLEKMMHSFIKICSEDNDEPSIQPTETSNNASNVFYENNTLAAKIARGGK